MDDVRGTDEEEATFNSIDEMGLLEAFLDPSSDDSPLAASHGAWRCEVGVSFAMSGEGLRSPCLCRQKAAAQPLLGLVAGLGVALLVLALLVLAACCSPA